MVTLGAVKEREYTLIEQGEYVLTLSEMDESTGQWGDRLIWKFLIAPREDPTAYVCKQNGDEYTLWAFTDQDIILGSLGHEFAQALSGRTLDKNDAPPSEDDLLGKRCIGYITHYTPKQGKNAGKKMEKIVEGSIKPFRLPPSKKVNGASASAPVSSEADDDAAARSALIAEAKRQVGKAIKFETPSAEGVWAELNLDALADEALHMIIRDAKDEIQAALDA